MPQDALRPAEGFFKQRGGTITMIQAESCTLLPAGLRSATLWCKQHSILLFNILGMSDKVYICQ